jgi:hypothetical protein
VLNRSRLSESNPRSWKPAFPPGTFTTWKNILGKRSYPQKPRKKGGVMIHHQHSISLLQNRKAHTFSRRLREAVLLMLILSVLGTGMKYWSLHREASQPRQAIPSPLPNWDNIGTKHEVYWG